MTVLPSEYHHDNVTEKIPKTIPSTESFHTASQLFKQLSDSTRIKIFWILCHCEICVIHLAGVMNMSSPAVAHHLKLLTSDRLIVSRKNGKEVFYKAADNDEAKTLHHMIETLIKLSCPEEKNI